MLTKNEARQQRLSSSPAPRAKGKKQASTEKKNSPDPTTSASKKNSLLASTTTKKAKKKAPPPVERDEDKASLSPMSKMAADDAEITTDSPSTRNSRATPEEHPENSVDYGKAPADEKVTEPASKTEETADEDNREEEELKHDTDETVDSDKHEAETAVKQNETLEAGDMKSGDEIRLGDITKPDKSEHDRVEMPDAIAASDNEADTKGKERKKGNYVDQNVEIGSEESKHDEADALAVSGAAVTTGLLDGGSGAQTESNTVEESSVPDPTNIVITKNHWKVPTTSSPKRKEPRNELTHMMPGYTAPLRLVTTWADTAKTTKTAGASSTTLEDLRRKAVREGKMSKKLNENARLMSERSQTGSFTASYQESHASFHKPKRKRLASSTETAGAGWFNMKATPMTEEVERDLALIRNRNYLDPKRFYKSADKPKSNAKGVLQSGTVIEGPTEFYSSRLTKKQRRTNLVDEIMADPESSGWAQQKYKKMQQVQGEKARKWGKNIPNRQDYRKKKTR